MGNLSDGMQTVVDAIRASAESRRNRLSELHSDLSELRSDAHNLIERDRLEHRDRAQALRQRLSSERNAGAEATWLFMEGSRQFLEEVWVAVSELRSDTHNLLERDRLEHRDMTQALRERLSGALNDLRSDTHNLLERYDQEHRDMTQALRERLSGALNDLRSDTHKMLDEVASDRGQARQVWEGLKKKVAPETVPEEAVPEAVPAEEVAVAVEEKPAAEVALPPDEERVLEVIASHPEGVKLVDIGNKLGVDWRALIGPAKSLVDGGRVEKIETLYYPKGEGPQEEA